MLPTPAPASRVNEGLNLVRGRLMAESLSRLLDRVHGAREVLPHLAALERSLGQWGPSAITGVPAHLLTRMCGQLSSLPLPDDDAPLQDLLKRLLGELQAQQDQPVCGGDFDPERTVVIREISHSEFDAARAEQATTLHSDL